MYNNKYKLLFYFLFFIFPSNLYAKRVQILHIVDDKIHKNWSLPFFAARINMQDLGRRQFYPGQIIKIEAPDGALILINNNQSPKLKKLLKLTFLEGSWARFNIMEQSLVEIQFPLPFLKNSTPNYC